MIIRKGEFSFFCTVSSIKESGIFSADSTAFSNKLQNKEVKSRGYICVPCRVRCEGEKLSGYNFSGPGWGTEWILGFHDHRVLWFPLSRKIP